MIEVPLYGGDIALVDELDASLVLAHSWHIRPSGYSRYAQTNVFTGSRWVIRQMHRLLLGAKAHQLVDHINGNGLDNRRANLRLCTSSENGRNRRNANKNNTTGYRGVSLRKKSGRYQAYISSSEGIRIHLGFFSTAEDAALAYNEATLRHHGAFASLNEVRGG